MAEWALLSLVLVVLEVKQLIGVEVISFSGVRALFEGKVFSFELGFLIIVIFEVEVVEHLFGFLLERNRVVFFERGEFVARFEGGCLEF